MIIKYFTSALVCQNIKISASLKHNNILLNKIVLKMI